MYDPTFGSRSLARHLTKNDFQQQPALKCESHKKAVISQAVATARNGFSTLPLTPNDLAGRRIYQVNDLASDLVLRKTSENIRRITGAKQSSRMAIIRRLKLFCEEGMPFTIAKMDIKNFYQSIDQNALLSELQRRLIAAPSTRFVLNSLLQQCKMNHVRGLPPGLAISAELSEFYMQYFDREMRERLSAHFYARYVDDIIVVLPKIDNAKELMKRIKNALPEGLSLNFNKSNIYLFSNLKVNTPATENRFEYLGFEFSVSQINKKKYPYRIVKLDIAKSKLNKNKTRIIKSLIQYIEDRDFDDLVDRIRILTGGYQFFDKKRGKLRSAGLQHTYSLIDCPAPAVIELDRFLKALILSRSGPIAGKLATQLSNRQRKKLLTYSFVKGLNGRVHFRFSADRLAYLTECWKYA